MFPLAKEMPYSIQEYMLKHPSHEFLFELFLITSDLQS